MSRVIRKRKKVNELENLGFALDLMLSGHSMVAGSDFIMTQRDPYNAEIGHLDPIALRTYDQKFITTLTNSKSKEIEIPSKLSECLKAYREHRMLLGEYQDNICKYVLKYDVEASKELGNFDEYISKVVIRNDAEMNVLYDYIALYRTLNEKRAILEWQIKYPKLINNKNNKVVSAYGKAKFAILRLDKNLEHGGILTSNIITKQRHVLMDQALNRSRKEGCFFICSILEMGNYIMTSGGGIPIDATSSAGKSALTLIKKHLAKLRKEKSEFSEAIASCVREVYGFCLRGGALKYMTVG